MPGLEAPCLNFHALHAGVRYWTTQRSPTRIMVESGTYKVCQLAAENLCHSTQITLAHAQQCTCSSCASEEQLTTSQACHLDLAPNVLTEGICLCSCHWRPWHQPPVCGRRQAQCSVLHNNHQHVLWLQAPLAEHRWVASSLSCFAQHPRSSEKHGIPAQHPSAMPDVKGVTLMP